jgi:hemerythrin-like metal-binding protein
MKASPLLFETTVPRMDEEHETLLILLKHAEAICVIANAEACTGCTLLDQDKCAAEAARVIEALISYMQEHFKYEEQQMDWCVPQDHIVAHREAHDEIAAQVRDTLAHCRTDGNPGRSARALVSVLSNWLAEHTERHDVVLATFIGEGQEPDEGLWD